MSKFTIGIDFGTLSARAVLVDVGTGTVVCCAQHKYSHGVMEECLPDGTGLSNGWALQDPHDYLDALYFTVPELLKSSGVCKDDIIGIGTDFTSCTVMPVDRQGTPLCFDSRFSGNPHAYVKHWKHHSASGLAVRMTDTAAQRGEEWLSRCGGSVSSESALPKLWEVLIEAPEVYEAMSEWIEAADWIVWQLTGTASRNSCCAGYKCYHSESGGYPSGEYFSALDPRLENVVSEKLSAPVYPVGHRVGGLTEEMAVRLGLNPGTSVSAGNIDAHACVPSVGITGPGALLAILGTSSCFMTMSREFRPVGGVSGIVKDGILPGYYGYEAGQSSVGDILAWFTDWLLPEAYKAAAREQGSDIHSYLSSLCGKMKPGQSGLLALDWWNGNRSILSDAELTGLILGMDMQTRPEEIYRALIEATAYGARVIISNYIENGVDINEIYASGGISQKNPVIVQIYADILKMPIRISDNCQGPALGSAIWGAVAAGAGRGGYDRIEDAISAMSSKVSRIFSPIPENSAVYDKVFNEYMLLHDYYGKGGNDVMKRLISIKNSI